MGLTEFRVYGVQGLGLKVEGVVSSFLCLGQPEERQCGGLRWVRCQWASHRHSALH